MRLFQYEMKKLLFNKKRLILLAVMMAIYVLLGWSMTIEESDTEKKENNDQVEYEILVKENTGKLNKEQFEESKAVCEAAIAKYGKGEGLNVQRNRDAILKFHFQYFLFGQRVNEYWNGPEEQDKDDIKGIVPITEKLSELKKVGKTNSYEYKYYKERLETEQAIGEPIFKKANFGNYFYLSFEGMIVLLLVLMVLPFFISPLFTQEVKTDMDSIVLCSVSGRREIVTAKLLSAGLTSAIITIVYLGSFFIGSIIGLRDLSGLDAPVRNLEGLQWSTLNMSIGSVLILASLWLLLINVSFGLALAFISTRTKNQSAAFGLGIVVLLGGLLTSNLGTKLREFLWPIMDFNFGTMASFSTIFGGSKMYNIFNMPVSYGTVALMVSIALGIVACGVTYLAQKKRSVA